MNLKFTLVFVLIFMYSILPVSALFERTSESFNVSVDIVKSSVNIEVDKPSIYLGRVSEGYKTHGVPITVTNKGTAKVYVMPQLESDADPLFTNYLYFGTSTCTTTCKRSGEYNFTLDGENGDYIDEGEYDSYTFYTKMDLTEYSGSKLSTISNLSTQVVFWIMPA